jgi:DNA helicase-2/ATP-dependent DNA helicase PcrA
VNDHDELEEERRLMYVAMTRARNHLAVVYPLNAYATRRSADYSIDQLSRFIDRGVQAQMTRVVPTLEPEAESNEPSAPTPSGVDLRAVMRRRFRGASG